MTFEEIQHHAMAEWEALHAGEIPCVRIGTATCGRAAGALSIAHIFATEIERRGIEAALLQVGCLGLCYAEPIVVISKPGMPLICYSNVTPEIALRLITDYLEDDDPCLDLAMGTLEGGGEELLYIPELTRFEYEQHFLLKRCGYIDPLNINHYIATGGYHCLNKMLQTPPHVIIDEIERSGLRGRGGAGFPTGLKWRLCHDAVNLLRYIVCNADEGDPGAFVDRVILESDPHAILEGLLIGAHAVGASRGYVYCRSEYPLALQCLHHAVTQMKDYGLLGNHILGSDFNFHLEIVEGAGAFVCGEETALLASIEGRRGMPRPRPPYPVESGLWNKPTLVNNVKTFACIPLILDYGADWFTSIGTERSKGTQVFALTGKVRHTGLAEVPMGTTLHQLIYDIGGGIQGDKTFKAVQIGGPSGGCLPAGLLHTPIDFDSLVNVGAMMGSGGIVAMDETSCMVDIARYLLDFIQKESCGKCSLCRLGTRQMLQILEDIVSGKGKEGDIELLTNLAEDIQVGSLCGLGKTAPNTVLTTLRYFREEYEAHIREKCCPALVCKDLIAYYILPERCSGACDHCVVTCSTKAISSNEVGVKVIDQSKCVKCGTCLEVCPLEYSAVIKVSPPDSIPEAGQR